MIPKKIHLCWLGGGKYSPLIRHCIDSWYRILPDYEIILWDTGRFDVNSVPWVKEAFAAKKYAFASDYIRAYALYHEGGIYSVPKPGWSGAGRFWIITKGSTFV